MIPEQQLKYIANHIAQWTADCLLRISATNDLEAIKQAALDAGNQAAHAVELAARGNSSSRPEEPIPAPTSGVPKCPTMR